MMKRILIAGVTTVLAIGAVAATAGAAPSRTTPSTASIGPSGTPAGSAFAGLRVVDACPEPAPHHASCFVKRLVDSSEAPVVPAGLASSVPGAKARPAIPGLTPANLRSAYQLPERGRIAGTTVAIVDAFNDAFAESDLAVYRSQFRMRPCTTANGCFRKVNAAGLQSHYPPFNAGWSSEIALDLDMVSAVCPDCHILLVEANNDSLDDLGTAVNEAVALGAKYVSNSYGLTETADAVASDERYFHHPGVAITVSSGDYGQIYGVQYPASSQYVTAVGGTSLAKDSSARGWSEAAWGGQNSLNGAGSGCSMFIGKPAWQTDSGCTHRTVADVSAVADPYTGVAVYSGIDGGWIITGGTSTGAPIIAATYALAGDASQYPVPLARIYAHASDLNDVTTGLTGTCTPSYLCVAGLGYDGPTGLGTPRGLAAF